MKFDRILFPVDFSEQTRSAAPFVKAMANRFQAEVIILNVVELPSVWYGGGEGAAWVPPVDMDQMREEAEARLADYSLPELDGITVRRVIAEGDPVRQILCQANAYSADLIMMPTHGLGPYRSLLLGSVTAKVLHDTERPVWTGVHTPEFVAHDPGTLRRILCAVDRDRKDLRTIRWTTELANRIGAEVRLIHVIPGDPDIHEFTDRLYREQLFEGARSVLEKIEKEANISSELVLRLGKVAQVIHDEARNSEADLIVAGRGVIQKPLGRLRSTVYEVIRQAPCPVISV